MLTVLFVISLVCVVHALPSAIGSLSHQCGMAVVQVSKVDMVRNNAVTKTTLGNVKASPELITSSSRGNNIKADREYRRPVKPVRIESNLNTPCHDKRKRLVRIQDIEQIKYMASISSLCYKNDLTTADSLENMFILSIVRDGGYLAFIAVNKSSNDVIISFRGATGKSKWIDNKRLDPVPWHFSIPKMEGIQVHRGYSHIWDFLRTKIYQVLGTPGMQHHMKKLYPSSRVLIAGHSEGGAVASIAAMDLVNRGILDADKIELTTFGSLQVGNAEFSISMNQMGFQSMIRVFSGDDKDPYFAETIFGLQTF